MTTAYIITKPADEGDCKWCSIAKGFLAGHGFEVEVLPMPHAARQAYYKGSGTKTIPQIYIDGQHIGGYEDTVKWIEGWRTLVSRHTSNLAKELRGE